MFEEKIWVRLSRGHVLCMYGCRVWPEAMDLRDQLKQVVGAEVGDTLSHPGHDTGLSFLSLCGVPATRVLDVGVVWWVVQFLREAPAILRGSDVGDQIAPGHVFVKGLLVWHELRLQMHYGVPIR